MPKPILIAVSVFLLVASSRVHAQEMTVELDPAQTWIEFTLGASLHTVHGSFQLKSGIIHFDPTKGTASGTVTADATSADTGNKSRDHKMHTQVLESQKYPQVTFSPNKVSGSVSLQDSSTVQLEGIFRLHGDDHPMTLTVPVQIAGGTVTANTRFIVPYVAWGLKNPSTFLLHVSDKVQVKVTARGRVTK
ncbi:MAG TPA: YceI family protein [Terriglobales bacterium]|nr:YceI family protein [Terriglobales bacterium]